MRLRVSHMCFCGCCLTFRTDDSLQTSHGVGGPARLLSWKRVLKTADLLSVSSSDCWDIALAFNVRFTVFLLIVSLLLFSLCSDDKIFKPCTVMISIFQDMLILKYIISSLSLRICDKFPHSKHTYSHNLRPDAALHIVSLFFLHWSVFGLTNDRIWQILWSYCEPFLCMNGMQWPQKTGHTKACRDLYRPLVMLLKQRFVSFPWVKETMMTSFSFSVKMWSRLAVN